MADVHLLIDGARYPGWQRIEIQRSLDQLADSFAVSLVSPYSNLGGAPALDEFSPVEVIADGETLITGYVQSVDDGYTATTFSLAVTGASKAIDMTQCSNGAKKRWRNTDLFDIVSDLAAPFGIDVISTEVTPKIRTFALEEGETPFDATHRLVQEHGMFATSLADGTLVLTRTGDRQATTRLELGKNILEAGRSRSSTDRFSRYVFKAQYAGDGDSYGEAAATAKGEVLDAGVPRERPFIVQKDAGRGAKGLEARAAWERNTRAGKATTYRYRVHAGPGDLGTCWQEGTSGRAWDKNTIVGVRDRRLGIDGEYLIKGVTLSLDDSGHACWLELIHPDAYIPERPPKKKAKGGDAW